MLGQLGFLVLGLPSATTISACSISPSFTFSNAYFLNLEPLARGDCSLIREYETRVIDCHCLQMSSNERWARAPVGASLDVRLVNEGGDA